MCLVGVTAIFWIGARPRLRSTPASRHPQPHIIEAGINHVSGHKGGVVGIYNRATCDKEKREALTLWAERVMALVEGRKAVIVPTRKGAERQRNVGKVVAPALARFQQYRPATIMAI
jgi:hypothetical protein